MTYLANRWQELMILTNTVRYRKCNFSSLRSFNNVFFFLSYRLQYIIHITHKMHVSWLFMLSVRLPVKFLVSQKLQADFQLHRWLAPPPPCCSRVNHKQKIIVETVNRFLALGLSSCHCLCRPGSPSGVSGLLGISWGPITEHDGGEPFSETWLDLIWCRFFLPWISQIYQQSCNLVSTSRSTLWLICLPWYEQLQYKRFSQGPQGGKKFDPKIAYEETATYCLITKKFRDDPEFHHFTLSQGEWLV